MLSIRIAVWICCVYSVSAVYKRWITTTDFDNPRNWNRGHLPCPNDQVVFPASSPVVAINQDWTLSNMVLSNDGIIVLGDNLNIVFNDHPSLSDKCNISQEIRYNFTTAAHWLDPVNWCLPMHDFDAICFEGVLQMHTEMVPCSSDDVLFPGLIIPRHRSSFYVSLDIEKDLHLGTLKIGNQFYSTTSFQEYMATDIGKLEFIQEEGVIPSILNVTTRTCVDPAGCYCGTNESPWKEKICAYVGTCPDVYCQGPITPTGHCCGICGAKMELTINVSTYSVFHIRDMLNFEYIQNKSKNYRDVSFDISRLKHGNSQITLTDSSQGRNSKNLAAELRTRIQQDIGGENKYGVLGIPIYQVSGTPESTPSTTRPPTTVTGKVTNTPGNIATTSNVPGETSKLTSGVSTATTSKSLLTTTHIVNPAITTQTVTIPSETPKSTSTMPSATTTNSSLTSAYTVKPSITTQTVTMPSKTSKLTSAVPTATTTKGLLTTAHVKPTIATEPITSAKVQTVQSNSPLMTQTTGSVKSPEAQAGGSNDAVIIGGVIAGVCALLLGSLCVICFVFNRRQQFSSDPMSISIKFDDKGESVSGGTVSFTRGVDNPLYDNEDISGETGVPLSTLTSAGTAVGKVKPATSSSASRSTKKPLKKKDSTGFDNPLYYDTKTETVGSVDSNGNGNMTIANPIYDDESQPDMLQFEDNFM